MSDSTGDRISLVVAIVIFLALVAVAVWWDVYRYHDCLRVGHSKLYCILDIGH